MSNNSVNCENPTLCYIREGIILDDSLTKDEILVALKSMNPKKYQDYLELS